MVVAQSTWVLGAQTAPVAECTAFTEAFASGRFAWAFAMCLSCSRRWHSYKAKTIFFIWPTAQTEWELLKYVALKMQADLRAAKLCAIEQEIGIGIGDDYMSSCQRVTVKNATDHGWGATESIVFFCDLLASGLQPQRPPSRKQHIFEYYSAHPEMLVSDKTKASFEKMRLEQFPISS